MEPSFCLDQQVEHQSMLDRLFYRSSYQSCPTKKGVLRNFTKFTGKHMCQSLFNKVAGFMPSTLLKKETLAQVFSSEFCKISKNTFFTEHPWTNASIFNKIRDRISLRQWSELSINTRERIWIFLHFIYLLHIFNPYCK